LVDKVDGTDAASAKQKRSRVDPPGLVDGDQVDLVRRCSHRVLEANAALADLRADRFDGTAVLVTA
jgi:hypothetical protein